MCEHECSLSHIWRFAVDGAVYVGHGLQDVEGDKTNLVEAVTTLPPALGRFYHLSDTGATVTVTVNQNYCVVLRHKHFTKLLVKLLTLYKQKTFKNHAVMKEWNFLH